MITCPPEKIKTVCQFSEYETELRKMTAVRCLNGASGYFESTLFFRGQPGKEEIVATLFRDKLTGVKSEISGIHMVLKGEYSEICRWVSRANLAGLKFPFDIWNYLKYNGTVADAFVGEKSFLEPHYPILSLSRHHGCKNRLIDFTKDGYAGLFFALVSAFQKIEHQFYLQCDGNELLADGNRHKFKVWLEEQFARVWVIEEMIPNNSDIVFPDYGNNKFALAQRAVFILAPTSVVGMTDLSWEKLIFSKNLDYYGFECQRVFEIPYRSVPTMLMEMEQNGLNHIKYFPTFDSVTESYKFHSRVARIKNLFHQLEF